jgi:hypothetical protein
MKLVLEMEETVSSRREGKRGGKCIDLSDVENFVKLYQAVFPASSKFFSNHHLQSSYSITFDITCI